MPSSNRLLIIDFLRILSATLVFLYHFDIYEYGYLGVDIFFFLSGFVLTLTSYKHQDPLQFIVKRIKRILIPLSFVVFFTLIIFDYFQSGTAIFEVYKTALASLIGIANIQLFIGYDYFSDYNVPNPLLHFWSISAEISFYLTFYIFWKLKIWHKQLLFISLISMSAYLISNIFLFKQNELYLIGFDRFFAFAAGGLVSCLYFETQLKTLKKVLIIITGLGLLLIGFLTLSESYSAIVIGGMIIILTMFKNVISFTSRSSFFRHTANTTYEIYLIHLPVKVLVFDYFLLPKTNLNIGLCGLFILFASSLVYTFFDPACEIKRLKFLKNFQGRIYPLICAVFLIIFLVETQKTTENKLTAITQFSGQECETDRKFCNSTNSPNKAFLYGDSNARQVVDLLLVNNLSVRHLSSNCIFQICTESSFKSEDYSSNLRHLEFMKSEPSRTLVVGFLWSKFFLEDYYYNGLLQNGDQVQFAKNLGQEILKFTQSRSGPVIIFGAFPGTDYSLDWRDCVAINGREKCDYSQDKFKDFNFALESHLLNKNVYFINPSKLLCSQEDKCINVINEKAFYKDQSHLSQNGMNYLLDKLKSEKLFKIQENNI